MRQRTSVVAAAVFLIGGVLALPVTPATAQNPVDQNPADQGGKVLANDNQNRSAQPAGTTAQPRGRTHRRASKTVRVRTSFHELGYRYYGFGFRRAYLGAYRGGPYYSAAYYGTSGYDGHPYDAAYNGTGLIRDLPYRDRVRLMAGVPR